MISATMPTVNLYCTDINYFIFIITAFIKLVNLFYLKLRLAYFANNYNGLLIFRDAKNLLISKKESRHKTKHVFK